MTIFRIIITLCFAIIAGTLAKEYFDNKQDTVVWDRFIQDHSCRVMSQQRISSRRDITTWLCDDGVTYTR